jgi:hypothetical protein
MAIHRPRIAVQCRHRGEGGSDEWEPPTSPSPSPFNTSRPSETSRGPSGNPEGSAACSFNHIRTLGVATQAPLAHLAHLPTTTSTPSTTTTRHAKERAVPCCACSSRAACGAQAPQPCLHVCSCPPSLTPSRRVLEGGRVEQLWPCISALLRSMHVQRWMWSERVMNLPCPVLCDDRSSGARSSSSGGEGVGMGVSVTEQDTGRIKLRKLGGDGGGRGYSSARHISCACLPWRASLGRRRQVVNGAGGWTSRGVSQSHGKARTGMLAAAVSSSSPRTAASVPSG